MPASPLQAFEDWIGEISLGKEVSKAFEQAEEDEEQAEQVCLFARRLSCVHC